MQSTNGGGIAILLGPQHAVLPVVQAYRHVGAKSVTSGGLGPEITRRGALIRETARPLIKRVLRNTGN